MRLVVTGATGFVGARVIDCALSRGYEVTALARDPERIATRKGSGLRVEQWTVGDPLPPLGRSDAVLHLAAYIPADLSDPREAARCFEVNTNGALEVAMRLLSGIGLGKQFSLYTLHTKRLLEAMHTHSGRQTIVDSSKLPGRAMAMAQIPGIDM